VNHTPSPTKYFEVNKNENTRSDNSHEAGKEREIRRLTQKRQLTQLAIFMIKPRHGWKAVIFFSLT
jgi:hypothetical protein